MRAFIRNLSAPAEFALVMCLAFGLSILFQVWSIARHDHEPTAFSNDLFLWSVIGELTILGIVLWIGRLRGWSFTTFGFRISWRHCPLLESFSASFIGAGVNSGPSSLPIPSTISSA